MVTATTPIKIISIIINNTTTKIRTTTISQFRSKITILSTAREGKIMNIRTKIYRIQAGVQIKVGKKKARTDNKTKIIIKTKTRAINSPKNIIGSLIRTPQSRKSEIIDFNFV